MSTSPLLKLLAQKQDPDDGSLPPLPLRADYKPPEPTPEQPQLPPLAAASSMKGFGLPQLPPSSPRAKERESQRSADESQLAKLNAPHLGEKGSKLPGFGGKILHFLGEAAQVPGNVLFPGAMSMIPGTDLHNQEQRTRLTRDLTGIGKEEQEEGKNESEAGLHTAQARNQNAEADERENPADKPDKFSLQQTDQGLMRIDNTTGEATPVTVNGKGLGKPDAPDQFVYQQTDHGLMRINKQSGEAAPVMFNGQPLKPFEKPPVVNVNAQNTRNDKNYQFESKRIDTFGKPIEEANARFGRLQDTLNQRTPQADSLIAPELLTVMAGGQGSGLRMNEAEIARIVGGRTNLESLKAALNKWQVDPSKGLSITESQRTQVQALMSTVHQKLLAKQQALEEAREALVNTDDPKEMKRITAHAHQTLNEIDNGNVPRGTSERPAGVPADYVLKDGPKGYGYYPPEAK